MQLIEIHDQSWFPGFLRDQVTDALQAIFDLFDLYRPILHRLSNALQGAGANDVLDLCSGAGGPWPRLSEVLNRDRASQVNVYLTDKYPHARNARRGEPHSCDKLHFYLDPIDATKIPAGLHGFRTIFNSFHHFQPPEARAILQNAIDSQQGIGIFELPARRVSTVLLVFLIPVADWIVTPFVRPFRWSRLLYTYVIPVIPAVLLFDGIVSCLRAYSPRELREMTEALPPNQYEWHTGEEKGGFLSVPITYLIGYPNPALRRHVSSGVGVEGAQPPGARQADERR
jgi:hypothetical protein